MAENQFGLHPENDWEWAWGHRRIFKEIPKDLMGGSVVGMVTAIFTAVATTAPDQPINWRAGVIAGVLAAIVGAILMPLGEALIMWVRNARTIHEHDELRTAAVGVESLLDGYRRSNEALASSVNQLREILNRTQNNALANGLRDRLTAGENMWNTFHPAAKADVETVWRPRADAWLSELLAFMHAAEVSQAVVRYVETVECYERMPGLPVHASAIDEASIFLARIKRLENIICKYSQNVK
jgi:hypothetical protein